MNTHSLILKSLDDHPDHLTSDIKKQLNKDNWEKVLHNVPMISTFGQFHTCRPWLYHLKLSNLKLQGFAGEQCWWMCHFSCFDSMSELSCQGGNVHCVGVTCLVL